MRAPDSSLSSPALTSPRAAAPPAWRSCPGESRPASRRSTSSIRRPFSEQVLEHLVDDQHVLAAPHELLQDRAVGLLAALQEALQVGVERRAALVAHAPGEQREAVRGVLDLQVRAQAHRQVRVQLDGRRVEQALDRPPVGRHAVEEARAEHLVAVLPARRRARRRDHLHGALHHVDQEARHAGDGRVVALQQRQLRVLAARLHRLGALARLAGRRLDHQRFLVLQHQLDAHQLVGRELVVHALEDGARQDRRSGW